MAARKKHPALSDPAEAERRALHASIVAAREDDTPRLVYADWLDEHGEHDRAEFIRLGCRAGRLEPGDPERSKLERRLMTLLRKHLEWFQEVPRWAQKGVAFRRGFPDSFSTSATLWLKHADELVATVPITGVRLERVSARLPELLATPSLSRLSRLSFSAERLGDAGVHALAGASTLANLRTLSLYHTRVGDDGLTALAGSRHLAGLVSLNLWHNRIGPRGVKALARTRYLLRLEELELKENAVGDAGLVALAGSPVLAGVRRLWLAHNEIGDAGAVALANSPHAGNLRWLALDHNAIAEAGALALAASPTLGKVEYLTMDRLRIGPTAAKALRQRFGKRVRL